MKLMKMLKKIKSLRPLLLRLLPIFLTERAPFFIQRAEALIAKTLREGLFCDVKEPISGYCSMNTVARHDNTRKMLIAGECVFYLHSACDIVRCKAVFIQEDFPLTVHESFCLV